MRLSMWTRVVRYKARRRFGRDLKAGRIPYAKVFYRYPECLKFPPGDVGECDNKECPRDGSTSGGVADTERTVTTWEA